MWAQRQTLATDPAEWLGQWHPLAAQLGSADGLVALASLTAALNLPPIADLPTLRQFIHAYHERVLRPIELPAILRAYNHTAGFELRELIAFDQELGACPELQPLAEASMWTTNRTFWFVVLTAERSRAAQTATSRCATIESD